MREAVRQKSACIVSGYTTSPDNREPWRRRPQRRSTTSCSTRAVGRRGSNTAWDSAPPHKKRHHHPRRRRNPTAWSPAPQGTQEP